MGKVGKRVKKENEGLWGEKECLKEELEKVNKELMNVKKINIEYMERIKELGKEKYENLCENDILEKELVKVKKKNEELEENLKLFDEVKKRNEKLEERLKLFDEMKEKIERLEEENSLQKEEISKWNEENDQLVACNENLRLKPLVCDVSYNTSDLCERVKGSLNKECKVEYSKDIGSTNFVICDDIAEECKDANDAEFANIGSCFDDNVGLKIMNKIGYKGEGLGKHARGVKEPIAPVVRAKYEGLKYRGKGKEKRNVFASTEKSFQEKEIL